MDLSEMPGSVRVGLEEESREDLWNRIDNAGGIREYCSEREYVERKLYNWKSKGISLPAGFVSDLLDDPSVRYLQGRSSSGRLENPDLPLEISDELYSRTEASVSVNREGTPVYSANELSLVRRYRELLDELGEMPVSVYIRERKELRFPKFIYRIIASSDAEKKFGPLFDEKGEFRGDRMVVGDQVREVENFDSRLYSMEKRYRLLKKRGDGEGVEKLIREQVRKASSLRQMEAT